MASQILDVDKIQAPMKATHESRDNLSYEWRIKQLQILERMLVEKSSAMREAMSLDLGRDPIESIAGETKTVEAEVSYALKNLKKWMSTKQVPSTAVMIPGFSAVEPKPLVSPGVLIIGPFNYPLHLVFRPLVGVLAGGNPAVIKPSELCPRVGKLIKDMVENYFEPGVVQVILGGVEETTALLEKPWGKVVFTGSGRVGSIVAQACAKTLTPAVLELGGKSPVIVDEDIPSSVIQNVADRIIFAKCMNTGQTCLAPDTLFVHKKHTTALCSALVQSIENQFGKDQKRGELGRIVNAAQTTRILELIKDVEGSPGSKLIHGGSKLCDVDTRYICPTLILNPPHSSRVLQEEIFGPVLPIVPFESRDEAIDKIRNLDGSGTPLQIYVFTTKNAIFKKYTDKCRSSASVRNDCLVQASSYFLPFGGLGTSGYGSYSGKFGFDEFTHLFPKVYRPVGSVWDLNNLRCHPYAGTKGKLLEKILLLPDIGVLHTRKLLFGIGLLALLLGSPSGLQYLKLSLADILEMLVEALRK